MTLKVVRSGFSPRDPQISHDLPLAQIVTNPDETPGPSFSHPPDRCTCPKPEITPILWSRVATTSLAAFLGNGARFYMTARFSRVQPQTTPTQAGLFLTLHSVFQPHPSLSSEAS